MEDLKPHKHFQDFLFFEYEILILNVCRRQDGCLKVVEWDYFLSIPTSLWAALGGLVVSMLATGPMGLSVAGSGMAEDGGFLWVIIRSVHFLRKWSKAFGPMS
jgi:hypothetical protein